MCVRPCGNHNLLLSARTHVCVTCTYSWCADHTHVCCTTCCRSATWPVQLAALHMPSNQGQSAVQPCQVCQHACPLAGTCCSAQSRVCWCVEMQPLAVTAYQLCSDPHAAAHYVDLQAAAEYVANSLRQSVTAYRCSLLFHAMILVGSVKAVMPMFWAAVRPWYHATSEAALTCKLSTVRPLWTCCVGWHKEISALFATRHACTPARPRPAGMLV
jgi:hypothetical protein